MAEYSNAALQTVDQGQNILFGETPVPCSRGYVIHRTEPLSIEEAEDWVASMHGEGGKTGGRWKPEETDKFAKARGMTTDDDLIEFYAVMNAMYSDYCSVAKKHGITNPEFYADMAKAFIDDPDAVPGKTALYFEHIVDG